MWSSVRLRARGWAARGDVRPRRTERWTAAPAECRPRATDATPVARNDTHGKVVVAQNMNAATERTAGTFPKLCCGEPPTATLNWSSKDRYLSIVTLTIDVAVSNRFALIVTFYINNSRNQSQIDEWVDTQVPTLVATDQLVQLLHWNTSCW